MSIICKPFVFVRHGETPLNREQLIGGSTDVPLTENGKQQAERAQSLLARFHWNGIGVSPLLRAQQTAERAVPGGIYTTFDGLQERDWGHLEGRPWSEITPYEDTPPGGESWEVFLARVTGAVNAVLSQFEYPLIVAHSGVFRVLNYYAFGTAYGNRVGNVEPMWISPGQVPQEWRIMPLEQRDNLFS
ncbi:histidine phosphatase family protein [Citrobacter sp. JGM124]|uniref:histidine phosphatase family protein n=1 Tax=Citrobacter sp. JGM124 TaxID=2799789 RepID=UPI001BAC2BBA|nr:histidine phosphatase family protein [Citrobacter sp. JGM124]MBS0848780.1 histidine phosphatase family protein [Citrobacter sp. JGM124]